MSQSESAGGALASQADAPNGKAAEGARADMDAIAKGVGLRGERSRGWFTKVVGFYLRHYQAKKAKRRARVERRSATNPTDAAHAAILKACVKSAVTGAAAGTVSTMATLFTAETEGVGGFVAIPVAAVTIGGEMLYRSFVHLDLTCELAEIFGINFDPNDRDDLWRLYALVFNTHDHDDEDDPGQELVSKVSDVEREQVSERIGHKVLGESVARNVVPFVGIGVSAVTNFMLTRRLGNTVRRYMRYERAMHDAFAQASVTCKEYLDLLIEGMWFIFTADGKLAPEEAATLAHMLDKLDPIERAAVQRRFVEDELEWADRIEALPESVRDHFLHALEVAAAVDKEISLPERKILRRAAHHLNREFDLERLQRMIHDFEESGVLTEEHQRVSRAPT